jgi:hypothetical protein
VQVSHDLESSGRGPLEVRSFPDVLTARVVTPGCRPLLHGYDVESDLALAYGPAEVMHLALTGELPEPAHAAALNVLLVFLAPLSVACAPTHAAVLARLSGAESSAMLAVASITLAEQSKQILEEHRTLLLWLNQPTGGLPPEYRTHDPEELAAVERLVVALDHTIQSSIWDQQPTLMAALLSALFACGVRERHHLEALLVWARLPVVLSEAFSEKVANFKHYPINLPRFHYEEP